MQLWIHPPPSPQPLLEPIKNQKQACSSGKGVCLWLEGLGSTIHGMSTIQVSSRACLDCPCLVPGTTPAASHPQSLWKFFGLQWPLPDLSSPTHLPTSAGFLESSSLHLHGRIPAPSTPWLLWHTGTAMAHFCHPLPSYHETRAPQGQEPCLMWRLLSWMLCVEDVVLEEFNSAWGHLSGKTELERKTLKNIFCILQNTMIQQTKWK